MKIKVQLSRKENLEYFHAQLDDVIEVEFEEYVAAVVASEIGNSHIEACKAQAVAARSFAISRGVLRGLTISDMANTAQAYRAKRYDAERYPNCIQATTDTASEVLMYKDRVINSIYTASNGGRTVSAADRWGGTGEPFLIEQDDPWDKAAGYEFSGTGVGMSQRGCIYAAKQGIDYHSILKFYYPKTYFSLDYGETKAKKVVAIAKSCMGYPYVFGAVGEACTPALRGRRMNAAYPTIKSKCQVLSKTASSCDGCKYQGQQIFDCRGFTYYCLKQVGIEISTVGATTQYNGNYWVKKGEIKNGMPNVVCCVFKYKDGKMSHTGLHIGDGYIIHCSGEVKNGAISDTSWTHYAIPKGLHDEAYLSEVGNVSMSIGILRRGSSGEAVTQLQTKLNELGYDCGKADGKFGAQTETAVKKFQKDNNLTDDGKAGPVTLQALEEVYNKAKGIMPTQEEDEQEDIGIGDDEEQEEETPIPQSDIKAQLLTLITNLMKQTLELYEKINSLE